MQKRARQTGKQPLVRDEEELKEDAAKMVVAHGHGVADLATTGTGMQPSDPDPTALAAGTAPGDRTKAAVSAAFSRMWRLRSCGGRRL